MATKRNQNQSVVLATLVIAALVPTFGAITNYIQSRSMSQTVQETHRMVNSKSDDQIAQIKELIAANKELATKVATLEERLRPINTDNSVHTLTDEQFKILLKRKE